MVHVWDLTSGEVVTQPITYEYESSINSVAFSPDGQRVISGGRGGIVYIWDLESNEDVVQLTGHIGSILSVSFSPDGTRVLSSSSDSTVRVWDVE